MSVSEPEVCYKCHPRIFALNALPSHHPIMEGKMVCSDCHEPHGTVAENLLRQPATFLCLRCHTGHRAHHGGANINGNMDNQNGFYTNCTRCHTQIHGSDTPAPWTRKTDFMR